MAHAVDEARARLWNADADSDPDRPTELFDSKLQQLLKNAEARLSKAVAVQPAPSDGAQAHTFGIPRLANPLAVKHKGQPESRAEPASGEGGPEIAPARKVELSKKARKETLKKRKAASAGADWYGLPRTQLDPKTKRDLQLLQMRNVIDPHRHYRKTDDAGKLPQYSQVGTVIEGPTEYFSARLKRKDRTDSLAKDLLAGNSSAARFKSKYADIQAKSTSGRKAHYKAVKAKRSRLR